MANPRDVTALIMELRGGDHTVVGQIFPLVYDELQRIANRLLLRERRGHTLSTKALVHEAYTRMVDQRCVDWRSRAHFCAVAAQAMRRILIDYARRRHAAKRGGKQHRLTLDAKHLAVEDQAELLVSLDQALDRLSAHDERLVKVVELRFFGGLSEEEAAEVLDVSARTIRRDWVKARAWLYKELYPEDVQ